MSGSRELPGPAVEAPGCAAAKVDRGPGVDLLAERELGPGQRGDRAPLAVELRGGGRQPGVDQTGDEGKSPGQVLPGRGHGGHQALPYRCRGGEAAVGHLVGHRAVVGMTDAGPDRDRSGGDGVGHHRHVEHVERRLGAAAPDDHRHVDVGRTEGGQRRPDGPGRSGPLDLDRPEGDREREPAALELAHQVAVAVAAPAGDQADPQRQWGEAQAAVGVE